MFRAQYFRQKSVFVVYPSPYLMLIDLGSGKLRYIFFSSDSMK